MMVAATNSGHYLELLAHQPAHPVPIDVIVVPAARSASSLLAVSELAAKTLTPLVVLGSREAKGDDIAATLAEKSGLQWAAVEVPDDYEHPLLHLSAADYIPEPAQSNPRSDLSLKRNIGLLIGRQFGHRLFFMDDDIQISPPQLEHAGRLLSEYALAGFRSVVFPDKSVVGHMEHARQSDKTPYRPGRPFREDIFLSGNALAVNLNKVDDHFPDVYNEDWLFMLNSIVRREAVSAGEAWQAPYNPMLESRARREEFGEVIADGIYDACINGQMSQLVRARYWDSVIDQRRNRINTLRDGRRARADAILRAALAVSAHITPDVCAEYVESLYIDQLAWRVRLAKMPAFTSLHHGLRALDLSIHAKSAVFPV